MLLSKLLQISSSDLTVCYNGSQNQGNTSYHKWFITKETNEHPNGEVNGQCLEGPKHRSFCPSEVWGTPASWHRILSVTLTFLDHVHLGFFWRFHCIIMAAVE